jgi:hypothetical protein
MTNALNLNILGFPAVNQDLKVELRDPLTREVVTTARPFADGSVRVPKINAGAYEMAVIHPQLALPVLQRPIRVLPAGETTVSVLIDPSKFRNTPIEDIPDANLGPVRDRVASVAETVLPLSQKVPGEAIRSDDFNGLGNGVRDVALAVSELTRLVTPVGHSHPEVEAKLTEMQGNFDTLVSTLTVTLTELQRQLQAQRVRAQIEDVIEVAKLPRESPQAKELLDTAKLLDQDLTASPTLYGRVRRDTGQQLATKVEALIETQAAADPVFAQAPEVKALVDATDVMKTHRATSYGTEITQYRREDQQFGGGIGALRK